MVFSHHFSESLTGKADDGTVCVVLMPSDWLHRISRRHRIAFIGLMRRENALALKSGPAVKNILAMLREN
jgi:hypothetical protein